VGTAATCKLSVELGEVVALRYEVGLHLDAGQLGELLEQRLEALLVGVRRLQDLDGLALGLFPVEGPGDGLGAVDLACRRATSPDAAGSEQGNRGGTCRR
jgi:hypothetical protein